jgi:hypothetical protein
MPRSTAGKRKQELRLDRSPLGCAENLSQTRVAQPPSAGACFSMAGLQSSITGPEPLGSRGGADIYVCGLLSENWLQPLR